MHMSKVDDTVVATDKSPATKDVEPGKGSPLEGDKRLKPRLPKFVLPKFSGDVTKFCSFWDSFKSAVDKNSDCPLLTSSII